MRILITAVVLMLACGVVNAQEVEVELRRMRGWYAGGGLALATTGVGEADNPYGEYDDGSGDSGFVINTGYRLMISLRPNWAISTAATRNGVTPQFFCRKSRAYTTRTCPWTSRLTRPPGSRYSRS